MLCEFSVLKWVSIIYLLVQIDLVKYGLLTGMLPQPTCPSTLSCFTKWYFCPTANWMQNVGRPLSPPSCIPGVPHTWSISKRNPSIVVSSEGHTVLFCLFPCFCLFSPEQDWPSLFLGQFPSFCSHGLLLVLAQVLLDYHLFTVNSSNTWCILPYPVALVFCSFVLITKSFKLPVYPIKLQHYKGRKGGITFWGS